MKRYALLAILAVAPAVVAQQPATATPTPPAAPKMTEHQQDRLELCLSKMAEIETRYQAQMMQESSAWSKEASDIIAAVQKENPDFIYHVAQSQMDHSGWIRKPKPAPAAAPEPAPSPVSPQKPAGGVLGGQGQTPQPATAPKP
jgi:hypothetical protein